MDERQEQIRRYATLVEAALPRLPLALPVGWLGAESEEPPCVQVERGLVFPVCWQRLGHRHAAAVEANAADPQGIEVIAEAERFVARLIDLAPEEGRAAPDVVDRSRHRRPAYRGLLVYAWLQALRLLSGRLLSGRLLSGLPASEPTARWHAPLLAWCRHLEADVAALSRYAGAVPAAAGAEAVAAAWAALSIAVAGMVFSRDDWSARARDVFTALAAGQQRSGALLSAGPGDNPEAHWYHELVLLHAAASYAALSGDRTVRGAVDRAAEYHQAETEPDHATGQPWALFAFASNPSTQPLADQVLHGALVHAANAAAPTRADGVSFILLADALYCLNVWQANLPPQRPTR